MKEFRTIVASPVGLHARPASLFSRSAKESGCVVRLAKVTDGLMSDFVDGASILRVMTLGVKFGDEIIVQVEGDGEESAAATLKALAESTDH
jgi:phosphocarrier protein HPr